MKKKNFKIAKILFFALTVFLSCEDRELFDDSNKNEIQNIEARVKVEFKNGRLSFVNKQEFTKVFKELAEKDDQATIDYLTPFYKQGFLSLRPKVTEQSESFIYEQVQKRIKNYKTKKPIVLGREKEDNSEEVVMTEEQLVENINETVHVIGESTFASLLNEKSEVKIGDSIYKYTDVGMFATTEKNVEKLNNFLTEKKISKDLIIPTADEGKNNVKPYVGSSDELIYLNSEISYFALAQQESNTNNTLEESNLRKIKSSKNARSRKDFENFVNGLNVCSPRNDFFQGIFGKNHVCFDQYESKRRVKTKAFSYNYFVAYAVGTKVVNQFRGWTGLWRQERAQEIILGVDNVQFWYDYTPLITSTFNNINQSQKFITVSPNLRFENLYVTGNSWKNYKYDMNIYPPLFRDGIVFESFRLNNDLLDQQIDRGIKELNKLLTGQKLTELFWKTAWSETNNILRDYSADFNAERNPNRTLISKSIFNGKVLVAKSSFDNRTNVNSFQKIYDWGVGIKINANPSNNFSISASPSDVLIKPTDFKCEMFGLVLTNKGWRGSKISF